MSNIGRILEYVLAVFIILGDIYVYSNTYRSGGSGIILSAIVSLSIFLIMYTAEESSNHTIHENIFKYMTWLSIFVIVLGFIIQFNYINDQQKIKINGIESRISYLKDHKYYLKEMTQKDLINGEIRGSYFFIAGSIYGKIEENMYLVITYYDGETGFYRITKFNLENTEIVTIDKDEKPHFKYSNSHINREFSIKLDLGEPRLFLPDGWSILEK